MLRKKSILMLKFPLLILGPFVTVACSGAVPEVLGDYVSVDGRLSEMQIRRNNGHLRIILKGGASSTDTDNAAADCEAVAQGEMNGDLIRARLVPFEGELNSLDASDIAQMDPIVLINIDKGGAVVRASFSHCGLRNSLAGKYKRVSLRPSGLVQGKWHASSDGEVRKALQLGLQSKKVKGFDRGEVVANQIFINRELDSYLAGATIWNSRYPGVSKCILVSKKSGGPVLLVPTEPDLDLPLSCTGEIAISFPKNGSAGSKALALFAYESPSGASIYYPLVLEIKNRQIAIDQTATQKVNKARDNGRKLQSIADLKLILNDALGGTH